MIVDDGHLRRQPPSSDDETGLLARSIELAYTNAEAGQLPFAAFVVRGAVVVGTGVNTALRDADPTAHAEVAAVRDACKNLNSLDLTGVTIISSCEPCAICHAVAAAVGVSRIVYAAPKEYVPDLGDPGPAGNHELMARMQLALRTTAPEQLIHIPTEGADQPFRRYVELRDAS